MLSGDFNELFASFKQAAISDRQKSVLCLNIWLQKYLQAKVFSSPPDFKTLTQLFEFTCENFTDAKPGYTNILKDLLKNTVSLRDKLYPEESYEPWVKYVVGFPASSKALYYALEPLSKYIPGPYEYGITETLYSTAFSLFASLQVASPVGKCLCALFKFRGNIKDERELQQWVDTWSPYIYATFGTNCRENVLIYVLGPMLRSVPTAFPYFYKNFPGTIEDKIGCLKIANDAGIDVEFYTQDSDLVSRLHDHSRFLRFEVLSLVLASKQVSKPIPSQTYKILKEHADVLFCEASPKFRNQVFAVIRKFLFRIRSSSYAQARDTKDNKVNQNVVLAEDFLKWLFEYMLRFLQPGSPYRCLVTGFQYLDLLLVNALDKSVDKKYLDPYPVPFPFSINLFTPDFMRALINNVPNDYYDIRQSAAKIIQMAPKPVPYLQTLADVEKIAAVSLPLIAGIRGRQGDGGARICQIAYMSYPEDNQRLKFLHNLISETDEKTQMAARDIRSCCQLHGLHGYFQALALIFEVANFEIMDDSKQLVNGLIKIILDVWTLTWDTLTNSAPEGNIPMPLDAMLDDDDVESGADSVALSGKHGATAQVLLSFSWRAVKESATLLTVLLQRFTNFETEQLENLLSIVVRQLTSIRHRGAYSSIAPAYEALCTRCYKNDALKILPLEMVQQELDGVVTKTQLITRRSAGLPMLITGALATNPDPKPAITTIMERLHEITKLELPEMSESMKLDLPQVHAFNCLRGTLREARLSKGTDMYVEPALMLAIEAFDSPIWSIRNCGVMLFSTLHIRLFGSSSTMGAGVFFSRFKAIKPLLYNHLVQYVNDRSSSADLETVYPILALLLRLRSIGENSGLEQFYAPIKQFLSSKIWKVREMSVWVLAAILHPSQTDATAIELLDSCSISDQNTLHGHLMAVNALAHGFTPEFISCLAAKLPDIYEVNPCRETKSEVVKLIKSSGIKYDFRLVELSEFLDPSQRVLNGLVAMEYIKQHEDELTKYLQCGQREVIESLLNFLHLRPDIVDHKIYESILNLLGSYVEPSIKAIALDIIAKVGTRDYGASYETISSIVYNDMEPLSAQQRALKCLGSLVPNDQTERWEKTIEQFCDDDSPLDSRLCAIDSIGAFVSKNNPSSRMLWQIYWLLSDDEEIVRTNVSKIASELLGGQDYAPRYCEPRILELVGSDFVRQALNKRDSKGEILAAKSSDETLFVSEKPNLYRNEFVQMEQIRALLTLPMHTPSEYVPLGDSANGDLQIALARCVE